VIAEERADYEEMNKYEEMKSDNITSILNQTEHIKAREGHLRPT